MINKLHSTIHSLLPCLLLFWTLILPKEQLHAFKCAQAHNDTPCTLEGASTSWFSRSLTFSLNANGTSLIGSPGNEDEELDVLRESFSKWGATISLTGNYPATINNNSCTGAVNTAINNGIGLSDISFTEMPLSTSRFIGYNYADIDNNENLVLFYDNDGTPEQTWPTELPLNVLALTTTTFNIITGELIDADIEINATPRLIDNSSVPLILDPSTHPVAGFDLQNTMVHEIGHFLGLAHSDVIGSTMEPVANPGDTNKRDLHCDDRNAMVFKYPKNAENQYCSSVETTSASCGCCEPPDFKDSNITISVVKPGQPIISGGSCHQNICSTSSVIMLFCLYFMFMTISKQNRSI